MYKNFPNLFFRISHMVKLPYHIRGFEVSADEEFNAAKHLPDKNVRVALVFEPEL